MTPTKQNNQTVVCDQCGEKGKVKDEAHLKELQGMVKEIEN